jgi:vibriolysin
MRYVRSRGAKGDEAFTTWRVHEDDGQAHIRMRQSIAGLPVVGADLIVHADLESGRVVGVNGRLAIDRNLPREPQTDANQAIDKAIAEYGFAGARVERAPELTYVVDREGAIRLAWSANVAYTSANGAELDRVFADAATGAAIARHAQVMRALNREMYDCDNYTAWSSCHGMFGDNPAFGVSSTPFDPLAIAAFDNMATVYDYFSSVHSQDSMNDGGMVIKQAVHYGSSNKDAGWIQSPWIAISYGDGLGGNASPVYSLDVVAHEFTHGVAHQMIGLLYTGETAAIHEGIADVFGAAVEAWDDGAVSSTVWQIGEDNYTSPLRYLNDPRTISTQVDYYPKRKGGGHEDAGLTGLPFYLVSQGGQHPRGPETFSVSAQGISTARAIFFKALVSYGSSTMNFRNWREATLTAATSLHGAFSSQYNAVWNAWAAVGNNWDERSSTLAAAATWTSSSFTTTTAGTHTGQLACPSGFHLFLEYWNGSTWVTDSNMSKTNVASNKLVEYEEAPAGTYRWRVYAASGSGSYSLFYNRPK